MSIEFTCPCGKPFRAKDNSAGRVFDCPGCGAKLEVPSPDRVDLGLDSGNTSSGPDQLPSFSKADPMQSVTAAPTSIPPPPQVIPCEYEYKMAQLPRNIEVKEGAAHRRIAADFLEEIVNRYAATGWEFFRVDTVGIQEMPGCLSSLFGGKPVTINYYVVTFRRRRG